MLLAREEVRLRAHPAVVLPQGREQRRAEWHLAGVPALATLDAEVRPYTFQAVIQNAEHWSYSEVVDCGTAPRPPKSRGSAAIASDVLTNFLHKYLYRQFHLSPTLQTASGGRPSLDPWYDSTSDLALWVRWYDPLASAGFGVRGVREYGEWVDRDPGQL